MWKHPLTWLGLAALVALAVFWDEPTERLLQPDIPLAPEFPEAYLIKADIRQYDSQGQLSYRMLSERAEHFQYLPDRQSPRDYSLVTEPNITVHGEGEAPWRLTARRGRSEDGGERLRFIDNVQAWQQRGDGRQIITTEALLIEPNRQYAETDKAVTMRSPRSQHTAVGLRAYLDRDYIELLSEVEGRYEPPEQP